LPEVVGLSSPALTSSRQEVPEPIGLGQSSLCKRLPGEEPCCGPVPLGPWPVTSRLAVRMVDARKRHLLTVGFAKASPPEMPRWPSALREPAFGLCPEEAASLGDQGGGGAEFGRFRSCARGAVHRLQKSTNGARPIMPSSEELEGSPVGLAPLRESERGAKERRKPNRRWQSREIGGGSLERQKRSSFAKARPWRHSSVEDVLGCGSPVH